MAAAQSYCCLQADIGAVACGIALMAHLHVGASVCTCMSVGVSCWQGGCGYMRPFLLEDECPHVLVTKLSAVWPPVAERACGPLWCVCRVRCCCYSCCVCGGVLVVVSVKSWMLRHTLGLRSKGGDIHQWVVCNRHTGAPMCWCGSLCVHVYVLMVDGGLSGNRDPARCPLTSAV